MSGPVLELSDISKEYQGLRPLRIERLVVGHAESVAIVGLDRVTAEVFVNLVTGATLPDRGEVMLFGRATSAIADSADWLTVVDRFGIVSERAVLLDGLSVIQNLSMPFTLEIEPPPDEVRVRAEELAREVQLDEGTWRRPLGELDRASGARPGYSPAGTSNDGFAARCRRRVRPPRPPGCGTSPRGDRGGDGGLGCRHGCRTARPHAGSRQRTSVGTPPRLVQGHRRFKQEPGLECDANPRVRRVG